MRDSTKLKVSFVSSLRRVEERLRLSYITTSPPFDKGGDKWGELPNKNLIKTKKGVGLDNNSIKVNCYSGHTYAERPKSFDWQGVNQGTGFFRLEPRIKSGSGFAMMKLKTSGR